MPVNRYFSSVSQPTTLAGNIGAADTMIGVVSPVGYPGSFPFTAALDYGAASEELVDVTAASGGTWTVVRGVDGTSAQSHSVGAVVRHVTSARDNADYQTHQAATAAVHGVAGTLVGTSDAQTLANKTLTSPTVNSGALSGTFTGSPTLSGAPTFSGGPTFNTLSALHTRANTTDSAIRVRLDADTQSRLIVQADGTLTWGTGAATQDTNLYRGSAGLLKTDSALYIAPSGSNGTATVNVTNGAFTGKLLDLQLAASSKASIDYQGNLIANNLTTGAWTDWTPTWSTTTGTHTPSLGNATITGRYAKNGRMLSFSINITFGSSTNFGSSVTTGDNWIFSLPGGFTAATQWRGDVMPCGFGRASQTLNATLPVIVTVDSGGNNFLLGTAGGRVDGGAVPNQGSLDSLTPWTWASGNAVQFWGTVETTT